MDPALANGALLVAASVVAGAVNAVAGGGSFLTFPSLIFAGVTPIAANATSTTALWPGSLASVAGYREELRHERRVLLVLGAASLVGGLAGAIILLLTPERTFAALVPWLLLGATALFAAGPWITRRVGRSGLAGAAGEGSRRAMAGLAAVQLVIAVYGGYFGGGIGILMLAALSVLGIESLHAMNGLKAALAATINGIAVVAFVAAGVIVWHWALVMVAGAIVGGYGGARVARKLPTALVRGVVIAIGLAMSATFFATGV